MKTDLGKAERPKAEKLKPESYRHRPVVSDAESMNTDFHRLRQTKPRISRMKSDSVVGQALHLPDSGSVARE
jgi:hypothetical protein